MGIRGLDKITKPVQPAGAWFVFGYDQHPYPVALCETEVEALRIAQKTYTHVMFWPFGKEWDEVKP